MGREGRTVEVVRLAGLCLLALSMACHADLDDPKGQSEELSDPVRREHAVGRLHSIFSQRLVEAKGDRSAASLKEFADQAHEGMVKTYLEHPEDSHNGLKLLSLMQEMKDPRTTPALLKALEWTFEVTEDHAVTAARTLSEMDASDADRGKIVEGVAKALKRVEGSRPVDNRMRKSFIEVLGKLKDKRATDTLVEIMLKQEESQSFLFNILAAQQLVEIADPKSIPALIKGLFLFDAQNPAMRMNDVATSGLVAVGKPALEPVLKVLRSEHEAAKEVVDLYLETIKQKDPNAVRDMDPRTIMSNEAAYTLGKLGFRDALDPLLEETQSKDPGRRFGAALALVSLQRKPEDTQRIMEAIKRVYDEADKQMRPQLLVAVRHLYAPEVMPFLFEVASKREDALPVIRLYSFAGYALLANKAEAKKLRPILDDEENYKKQLEEYLPALAAAEECDVNVECWVGKVTEQDKIILRKAANSLGRFGRGNEKAIAALVKLFSHRDLEVRNEALSAVDAIAVEGSKAAVDKISELQTVEGGRSIWNNFKREALPTRARLMMRAGA